MFRSTYLIPLLALAVGIAVAFACGRQAASAEDAPKAASESTQGDPAMFTARLLGPDGKLTGPVQTPKIRLTEAQLRARLPPEAFAVTCLAGTERPGSGSLLNNHEEGMYLCLVCGLPLYKSDTKFESGTGWPSFFQPVAKENIEEKRDTTLGMARVETLCARCGSHLGHVFDDGPAPTGLRYCMNSAALRFVATAALALHGETPGGVPAALADLKDELGPQLKLQDAASTATAAAAGKTAEAVLAGGCFWCVEGVFEQIDGVLAAESGYAGGTAETANYEAVCTGSTGHAEAVRIVYNPAKVSFDQLLKIHFATHDPTTLNRQGNDVGTQYRSTVFYADAAQKQAAEAYIKHLADEKTFGAKPVVTTLEPLEKFYPAETYHQDYACRNPNQPYISAIALPKIEKTRSKFADLLKPAAELKP